jgi:hypothetical protein
MKKNSLLITVFLVTSLFGYSQTFLLEEYFNDPENLPPTWTSIDQDGDGNNWRINTYETEIYAVSDSWYEDEPLTPENYLVSPQINLTGLTGTVKVRYTVQIADEEYFAEHYKLAVSTTGNQVGDFTNIVFEETMTINEYYIWVGREVDLTQFIGQSIYLTWCHFDCYDQYKLLLDSIQVMNDPEIGIPESNSSSIEVYPNPSNGQLFVNGEFTDASLTLYSTVGRKVYEAKNVNKTAYIDVTNYEKGLYLLTIKTDQGILTRKISITN